MTDLLRLNLISGSGNNGLSTQFQADKMMRALKKHKKTFSEIKSHEMPQHDEITLENDIYVWERLEAFLAEHLTP